MKKRTRPEPEPPIDATARRRIERRRLRRIVDSVSKEPSEGEMERLRTLVKRVQPKAGADEYWLGTVPTPLTAENMASLDLAGFGSLQPVGMPCQLARVTLGTAPSLRNAEQPEAAATSKDRHDTMLIVTADNRVRAIGPVLVQQENKHVMLFGRLALRKIRLSEEERLRINSAHNVLEREYLDYYTYADDLADADVTSDEHQRRYDKYYELVYVVSDCLLVHMRQINNNFLQRVTLVHNLTEMPLAQQQTLAFRRRMELISAAVAYAGGAEKLVLTIFLQPAWDVKHARAAMHAVPACLQGTAIDGVVFTPNDAAYEFGPNPRLLHFSAGGELTETAVIEHIVAALRQRVAGKQQ